MKKSLLKYFMLHKSQLMLITILLMPCLANASTTWVYRSYLVSTNGLEMMPTSTTAPGGPLLLESQLSGSFYAPQIDPAVNSMISVDIALTTSGGGFADSNLVTNKSGSHQLDVTFSNLPISLISDSNSWGGNNNHEEGTFSEASSPLYSGDGSFLIGAPGTNGTLGLNNGNLNMLEVIQFDLTLLSKSEGPAGYEYVKNYLNNTYIDILYTLDGTEPNWKCNGFPGSTGYGSQNGYPGYWADNNCGGGIGFEQDLYRNSAVSSVPVPAAIWLFGSGLLGLVGVARRKKASKINH